MLMEMNMYYTEGYYYMDMLEYSKSVMESMQSIYGIYGNNIR